MNRLFFVTGDKGGVGKTLISTLLADYFLRHDPDSFIGADCDVKGKEDRQGSFLAALKKGNAAGNEVFWDVRQKSGFAHMAAFLEKQDGKSIIVDSGANTMDSLTDSIGYLAAIDSWLKEAGNPCAMTIVCAVGNRVECALKARELARALKNAGADSLRAVFVLLTGDDVSEDVFPFSSDEPLQKAIKETSNLEKVWLGTLCREFYQEVGANCRLPRDVTESKDIPFPFRIFFKSLMPDLDSVIGKIAGDACGGGRCD